MPARAGFLDWGTSPRSPRSPVVRWCVRKLRVGIVDLVTRGPTRALYARIMHANLASIMPQVVGVWCEDEGHEVTFVCYTGFEDLVRELPADVDLVFIGAFTEAALLAYSLSNLFRSRGAVTVPAGPAARRLARSQFRGPVRRVPGRDRSRGPTRQYRLRRREQPVAPVGAARDPAQAQWVQSPAPGRRVVVRSREQVEDRQGGGAGQGRAGVRAR